MMDDALGAILQEALSLLEQGAADPHSPFHTLTLGTVDDGAPRLRSVILRRFEREALRLEIHSDARAPKIGELEAAPIVELLVWEPHSRRQLRLAGRASLHQDDARADAAWQALGEHTRDTYRVGAAPSSRLGEDEPVPPDTDDAAARAAFLVIEVELSTVEYLQLAGEGNRRARFEWPTGGAGEAKGCWLVP